MAFTPLHQPWSHTNVVDPFEVDLEYRDIPIGGKMLTATMELSQMDQMSFNSDDDFKRAIKQRIAADLARAMIEGKLIEFTHLPHVATGRDTIYARCYLAPDTQVKILRTHYAKPIRP